MWAASDRFLAACRRGGVVTTRVEVWALGVLLGEIEVIDGSVTQDSTRAGVRRSLTLTTTPEAWDATTTPGAQLRAWRGWRYTDGTVEECPQGVFVADSASMETAPGGAVRLTCPDLWALVQRARFEQPVTTTGLAVAEAARLASDALPDAPATEVTAASTVNVTGMVWERDRDQAIAQIAKSAGLDIHFDAEGTLVVRDEPGESTPVWVVNPGGLGVMLAADRVRSTQRVYNVVVASGTDVDGVAPFAPVVVADTDPASPTCVDRIGRAPYFFSSPLLGTSDQALAAARTLLERVRRPAVETQVKAVPNPALECGDTISVVLPDGTVETHLVDAVTTPLTSAGEQQITCRTTAVDAQ